MLLLNLLFLLLANAVSRREKSILYNRVAIIILLYCSMTALENLSIKDYGRGISIYGGLYQITGITESFEIFVYIVGAIILQLTGFYPYLQKMIKGNKLISKDDETYRHIEYPLIILFILLGATLLISSSDLVSMFLAIELQSYGCAPGEACVAEILRQCIIVLVLSGIFGLLFYRRYLPRVITGRIANNSLLGIADYKRIGQDGLPHLEIYPSGDSHGQVNEFDTHKVAQLGLKVLSRISRLLKGNTNVDISRPYNIDCQKPFAYFRKEDINAQSPKTITINANALQPRDLTASRYGPYLLRGRSFHSSCKAKENSQMSSLLNSHVSSTTGAEDLNHANDSESTTSASM